MTAEFGLPDGLISVIAVLISILGYIKVYYDGIIKNRDRIKEAEDDIEHLQERVKSFEGTNNDRRLAVLETKVDFFFSSIAQNAAKILHTPHPENLRRDELLEKFNNHEINREEIVELVIILRKIVEEKDRSFGERNAANILLSYMAIQYKVGEMELSR